MNKFAQRLRDIAPEEPAPGLTGFYSDLYAHDAKAIRDAADEIERLERRIEKLLPCVSADAWNAAQRQILRLEDSEREAMAKTDAVRTQLSHTMSRLHERERLLASKHREISRLRFKLYRQRQVEQSDHSTACSIWGDNGLGQTVEGWSNLPCNCGALINAERAEKERLRDFFFFDDPFDDLQASGGLPEAQAAMPGTLEVSAETAADLCVLLALLTNVGPLASSPCVLLQFSTSVYCEKAKALLEEAQRHQLIDFDYVVREVN